jgi:hypothetical protein
MTEDDSHDVYRRSLSKVDANVDVKVDAEVDAEVDDGR